MVPVPATAGGSPRAAPEAGAQLQGAERRARHQGTCGGRTPRPRGAAPPPRSLGDGEGGDARSGPGWAESAGRGAVELSHPPPLSSPRGAGRMGRWARGAAGGPTAVTRAHAAGPGTRLDPRHPPGPRPGVARGAPPAGAVPVTQGRAHRWRDAGCSGGAGLDLPGSASPPGGKSLRGAAASGC